MLSLANARNDEELRAWEQRVRNRLASEGITDPDLRVRRRGQDRRPRDVAGLRDGKLARGVTRGNGVIGEDVTAQPPDDEGRADRAADQAAADAVRGARRDLHPPSRLPRAQRAARRGGARDLRQSAQPRRRIDPTARHEADSFAAVGALGLRRRGDRRHFVRDALGGARPVARLGLPGQRLRRARATSPRSIAACNSWEDAPRRARLRDRRRRDQDQRQRSDAPRRRRRSRTARRDRLEVPAARGDQHAQTDSLERRSHGSAGATRRARTGQRDGRDRPARDAAQRGRPDRQGHPRGRRSDRHARGRRDPASRRPDAEGA